MEGGEVGDGGRRPVARSTRIATIGTLGSQHAESALHPGRPPTAPKRRHGSPRILAWELVLYTKPDSRRHERWRSKRDVHTDPWGIESVATRHRRRPACEEEARRSAMRVGGVLSTENASPRRRRTARASSRRTLARSHGCRRAGAGSGSVTPPHRGGGVSHHQYTPTRSRRCDEENEKSPQSREAKTTTTSLVTAQQQRENNTTNYKRDGTFHTFTLRTLEVVARGGHHAVAGTGVAVESRREAELGDLVGELVFFVGFVEEGARRGGVRAVGGEVREHERRLEGRADEVVRAVGLGALLGAHLFVDRLVDVLERRVDVRVDGVGHEAGELDDERVGRDLHVVRLVAERGDGDRREQRRDAQEGTPTRGRRRRRLGRLGVVGELHGGRRR
mmetsp:Transcript_12570/g.50521  ORF Transcript_12570/g.50521 Transcript_12570/m.50521 type:complete len:391 (-) Transcript_12570:637-1809(-)